MSTNPFGHIDLRVHDRAVAQRFYEQVLPALGFVMPHPGEAWGSFAARGDLPSVPYFAFTEDRTHVPNANRIAFWVPSREDVDRVADVACAAGALNLEGPGPEPYSSTYYAVFFEDPSGNRFEVYHRLN